MTLINVGASAPAFEGRGWLVDGQSGAIRVVRLSIDEDGALSQMLLHDGDEIVARWPLSDLRALRDQARSPLALQDPRSPSDAGRSEKQDHLALQYVFDPLARLYVDDTLTLERLLPRITDRNLRQPVPHKRRVFSWALAAIGSVALIIFVLVPVMADQLAEFLPPEGEKALGDATYEQIRTALSDEFSPLGACEQAEGQRALNAMTTRLTEQANLPYPVTVSVLDHNLVNAFALPGGRIVLFKGLIDAADDGEEVAAVLAHEIGHVAARDPTRGALRSAGSIGILGLVLGDFAGGTVVLFLANRLISAKYSQSAEAAADAFAGQLMRDANMRSDGLARFFAKLAKDGGDDEGGLLAHFMAHPALGDRIKAANLAGNNTPGTTVPVLTPPQWLAFQSICS